jgi:hypothetical protein
VQIQVPLWLLPLRRLLLLPLPPPQVLSLQRPVLHLRLLRLPKSPDFSLNSSG